MTLLQFATTWLVSGIIVFFAGWLLQGNQKKNLKDLFGGFIQLAGFIGCVIVWPIVLFAVVSGHPWVIKKWNQFMRWIDRISNKRLWGWMLIAFVLNGCYDRFHENHITILSSAVSNRTQNSCFYRTANGAFIDSCGKFYAGDTIKIIKK